jgi:predicted rRNA methylase YqxC with S4 and FtsJ domains
MKEQAIGIGFEVKGLVESPITGAKEGNVEYLVWLEK